MQNQRPGRPNNNRPRRHYDSGHHRPRHPDAEVDQRIRELDAERDPLSLPEEIVDEANRSGQSVGIPEGSDGSPINLAEMQKMQHGELLEMARAD